MGKKNNRELWRVWFTLRSSDPSPETVERLLKKFGTVRRYSCTVWRVWRTSSRKPLPAQKNRKQGGKLQPYESYLEPALSLSVDFYGNKPSAALHLARRDVRGYWQKKWSGPMGRRV